MSLRLDPRRLSALKTIAGESGMRPGELVRQWVEERIDAERHGIGAGQPSAASSELAVLREMVEALGRRVDALDRGHAGQRSAPTAGSETPGSTETPAPAENEPREPTPQPTQRVPLHEEIVAVIGERGPLTAAELAAAINERGRYAPPRSAKALDAAAVNSRVSNPAYRARFTREDGRIGLAEPASG